MKKNKNALSLYTLAVAALFLAGFLMLVVLGAGIYRKTVDSSSGNNKERALTAYITTCIRSGDADGAVYVENAAEGQVLVIAEGDTGYGLRIYRNGGKLLEDFGRLDTGLDPENAVVIGETGTFSIEEDGALLSVVTDGGRVLVTRRSERY